MAYTYYMNRFEGKITGAEILALLESLEHANKVFVEVQKKLCEAEGVDYANYGNENFCTLLLLHSDDNEILYAESAGVDDEGIKNGEIVLHCKKF